MLAPRVGLSLELHGAPVLLPVADRRERLTSGGRGVLPEVDDDRLAGGTKVESLAHRQRAAGPAPVLREGEEGAVLLEELHRLGNLVVQLELELDRVGLEVDQSPRRDQLRGGPGPAVEVDQELGGSVEAG